MNIPRCPSAIVSWRAVTASESMPLSYDAIVIGGGPAGATAAILLAQAGQRVAVVEKAKFPRRKVCGEFISATTWPLLRQLGVAQSLKEHAGPVVQRVGIFAGPARLSAPLTQPGRAAVDGGCAVGRELLDTQLLARAGAVGASIWQPWTLTGYTRDAAGYHCSVEDRDTGCLRALRAPVLIAAHGSWESGPLPTQEFRKLPRPTDMLGFKALFRGGDLPDDLMPLIAFAGGYGGLVRTEGNGISLSCCIRRDHLEAARARWPKRRAGDSVLAQISAHCAGVAAAVSAAKLDGTWLAAGPIRPGIHGFGTDGIFTVGNAAAEAHPIVAEGISMAIQSASLLCDQLTSRQGLTLTPSVLASIRRDYSLAWRRNFSARLLASTFYAQLFMRPVPTSLVVAALQRFPAMLTLGACWSGKNHMLRSPGGTDAPLTGQAI